VVREIIWKNSYIKVEYKTVYYKRWIDKGIIFIQDLLHETGRLLSKDELVQKTSLRIPPLQYEILISAIPRNWKKQIEDNASLNQNYLVFAECKIAINNTMKHISETNTKDIYWHLLTDITKRPTSEKKWREKTDLDLSDE
jgi:hypothetical protein